MLNLQKYNSTTNPNSLDIFDFSEPWFTKKELMMKKDQQSRFNTKHENKAEDTDKKELPYLKFKIKKEETSGYNLTEHSANIRVKINKNEEGSHPTASQIQSETKSSKRDKQNKRRRNDEKRSDKVGRI